jgi:hypothetical protein
MFVNYEKNVKPRMRSGHKMAAGTQGSILARISILALKRAS